MIDKHQIKLQRRRQIKRLPQTLDRRRRAPLHDLSPTPPTVDLPKSAFELGFGLPTRPHTYLDNIPQPSDIQRRPRRRSVNRALFQRNVTRSIFLCVGGPIGWVDRVRVGFFH